MINLAHSQLQITFKIADIPVEIQFTHLPNRRRVVSVEDDIAFEVDEKCVQGYVFASSDVDAISGADVRKLAWIVINRIPHEVTRFS